MWARRSSLTCSYAATTPSGQFKTTAIRSVNNYGYQFSQQLRLSGQSTTKAIRSVNNYSHQVSIQLRHQVSIQLRPSGQYTSTAIRSVNNYSLQVSQQLQPSGQSTTTAIRSVYNYGYQVSHQLQPSGQSTTTANITVGQSNIGERGECVYNTYFCSLFFISFLTPRKSFLESMFNATFSNIIFNETLNDMRVAFVKHYFQGTVNMIFFTFFRC